MSSAAVAETTSSAAVAVVDVIFADGGNDVIYGGNGNDDIFGDGGRDRVFGGRMPWVKLRAIESQERLVRGICGACDRTWRRCSGCVAILTSNESGLSEDGDRY